MRQIRLGLAVVVVCAGLIWSGMAEAQNGPPTQSIEQQIKALQEQMCFGARVGGLIDNGDGTVSDCGTGLMWEKKLAGASGSCLDNDKLHSVDATCDWFDATGGWIDELNNRCNNDPKVDCSVGGDADCSGVGGAVRICRLH